MTYIICKMNSKIETDMLTNQFSSITSKSTKSLSTDLSNSKMSTDKIPLFPKAKSMFLHSGNIINWNRLKRKPNQNSTEEFCECIGNTLSAYLESANKTDLQYVTDIYKVNTENIQVLDENERGDVKITVKVFICFPQPPSVISDIVNKVLNELGTSFVETVLLSLAPKEEENEDGAEVAGPNFKLIQPYWEEMQQLVSCDKVLSLGVCDLNKEAFEDLYNWAKVKPCIDQVNLESCCIMPKDLTEYAKSVNVQLLTHNDKPVFIPVDKLKETIQAVSTDRDSEFWQPQWAVRYSGIVKCRGIISMKGYIFQAVREKKH